MRIAIRLIIVSTIVVTAHMAAPSARAFSAPLAAAPAEPTEADLLGTWTGTISVAGAPEPLDGGIITITRADQRLAVTVGPNARVRFSCVRLARTERGLKFEVSMPDEDETRLLVYDVAFANGAMTGTVTFVRHGLTAPGQLVFTRQ